MTKKALQSSGGRISGDGADRSYEMFQPRKIKRGCNCQSCNHPETTGQVPERVIDPRKYFDFCTKTVCVDECIADDILALWQAGIFTRHSCCNHNNFDHADVALYDINDMAEAAIILRKSRRDWRVFAHTQPTT